MKIESQHSKSELIKKVTGDDDVQFIWLMATAEFEIEDHDASPENSRTFCNS